MKKSIILVVALSLISVSIFARGGGKGRGQGQGRGQGPFVTACEGLSEGASCSFTTRRGQTITATCRSRTSPRGETHLVCGEKPKRGNAGQ